MSARGITADNKSEAWILTQKIVDEQTSNYINSLN